MRILVTIGLLIVFIAWILYRLLIKKDLKQHLDTLYIGLFFMGVWAAIYFLFLT